MVSSEIDKINIRFACRILYVFVVGSNCRLSFIRILTIYYSGNM